MSPRSHIFHAATAATALHVLDDATLHREPGTTIADHLTGAGALLTVLAVAALVFPRLRAGSRAILALLVGFFDRYLLGVRTSRLLVVSVLPTGTVTFLLADIEGSTRLVQQAGPVYAELLGDARRILREAVAANGGSRWMRTATSCCRSSETPTQAPPRLSSPREG